MTPICPACDRPVLDTSEEETLHVYAAPRCEDQHLLDAVGYQTPISLTTPLVHMHLPCLADHTHLLSRRAKAEYQAWRVGRLEQEVQRLRTELERVCGAVEAIDPDEYYKHIEGPAAEERDGRSTRPDDRREDEERS